MQSILDFVFSSFRIKALLLIMATAVIYALALNNINLWSDEIYSVLMAKDSFKDMFYLLMTEDSKPPLYYLYLKGILALFPVKYEIFAAHFASYIILLVSQIFSATAIRKDFGDKIAIWMIFLIGIMPHSLWLAFEVRTYMLSAFLMFVALIYGIRLLNKPSKVDFAKFALISILALYSHYYCAVLFFFLYIILFIEIIRTRKYENLKSFIITSLGVGLLFAPWLIIPFSTGSDISKFWYVTLDFVKLSPMFFLNPLSPDIEQSLFYMATILLTSSFTFIVFSSYFNTDKLSFTLKRLFWISFGCFALSYLMLILLSIFFRPMVTARYLKIFSLIWYMAGAIALAQNKILQKGFIVIALLGFSLSYSDIRYASFDRGYKNLTNDIKTFLPKGYTLVTFDNSNLFCEYYLPEYKCLLIAGEFGEILRIPSVMKNIELYGKEPAPITYTISTHLIPANNIDVECMPYVTHYRYNKVNMHLCKVKAPVIKKLLNDSVDLRLYKYETR